MELLTIYYALALLLSIPWVRKLWNMVGEERGKILIYVGFAIIGVYIFLKCKNILFLGSTGIVVWGIFRYVELPIERLHFIQYGLLGWLIFYSLPRTKMINGFLFGLSVGVLDEVLQGILPQRVFDVRDVWMNGMAVLLGIIYAWLMRKETKGTRHIFNLN